MRTTRPRRNSFRVHNNSKGAKSGRHLPHCYSFFCRQRNSERAKFSLLTVSAPTVTGSRSGFPFVCERKKDPARVSNRAKLSECRRLFRRTLRQNRSESFGKSRVSSTQQKVRTSLQKKRVGAHTVCFYFFSKPKVLKTDKEPHLLDWKQKFFR